MIGLNNRAMPVMARTHTMRKDCTPSGMSFWMQTTLRPGGERYSRKDSAGNNYCNTDLRVLPMHIDEASGNGASTHPSPHERILRYLCKPGPYLLLGPLLLPRGSLLVLLLYLCYQTGHLLLRERMRLFKYPPHTKNPMYAHFRPRPASQ
jgi:hypothetical protein